MTGLGDRLDALVSAAVGDVEPKPLQELMATARRRRARRRTVAVTASLGAVAAVVAALAIGTGPTVQVMTSPAPVTAPAGVPPLADIASLSATAAATVPGPPAALGEVVATTTLAARTLLDATTPLNAPLGKGDIPKAAPTTAASQAVPDVAVWWALITRHHACPPGCADAAMPPTDYVAVVLRASDLRVLQVRPLGSEGRDLALAGPVYPLVLPGQALPAGQPAVTATVVPAATIEAIAMKDQGCVPLATQSGLRDSLPPDPGPVRCTSVTVRLYPNWDAINSTIPGVVEPGLAFSQPSRPIYYVTVWGQLQFAHTGLGKAPKYVDHINGIYDATTGQGEGGGTAGEPLP